MTSKSVATTRNEGREAYLIYYIQLIKVTVGSIQNILVTINLQIVTPTSSTVLLQNPRPCTIQPGLLHAADRCDRGNIDSIVIKEITTVSSGRITVAIEPEGLKMMMVKRVFNRLRASVNL
jgi:hypothetical protein